MQESRFTNVEKVSAKPAERRTTTEQVQILQQKSMPQNLKRKELSGMQKHKQTRSTLGLVHSSGSKASDRYDQAEEDDLHKNTLDDEAFRISQENLLKGLDRI